MDSWLTDGHIQQGLKSVEYVSTRWRTTEYNGRTRWEYVSTILSIEPAAIDLANVLTDIPRGGVGAEGVGGASLGIAGHVGTVSDGRCRL